MPRPRRGRRARPVGECPLCGRERKLCCSHIIPKFFLRDLRADGPNWFEHHFSGTRSPTVMQDGWKEHLLCRDCEQKIGRWEKTVSEELRGKRRASASWRTIGYDGAVWLPPGAEPRPLQVLRVQGCDYTAWRLFQLSVLFKMAKSRLEAFSQASLGDEEGTIREMLRRADPGDPLDYPCFMYILSVNNQPMKGFMNTPLQNRFRDVPAIELAFGGLGWFFILARGVEHESLHKMVVSRKGEMWLMQREAQNVRWLMDGLQRANVIGRADEAAESGVGQRQEA